MERVEFCVLTSVFRLLFASVDLLLSVNTELLLLSETLVEVDLAFVSVDLLVDSTSLLFTVVLPSEDDNAEDVLLLLALLSISVVPVVLLPKR